MEKQQAESCTEPLQKPKPQGYHLSSEAMCSVLPVCFWAACSCMEERVGGWVGCDQEKTQVEYTAMLQMLFKGPHKYQVTDN